MSKTEKVKEYGRRTADAMSRQTDKILNHYATFGQYVVLFLLLAVWLADIFAPPAAFYRAPGALVMWLFVYAVFSAIAYAAFSDRSASNADLLRECIRLTLLTWGIPVIIVLFNSYVIDGTSWLYLGAFSTYLGLWGMIILTYMFGWPREVMTAFSQGSGFFARFASIINGLVTFVLIFSIVFAVFGALEDAGVLEDRGVSSYEYQQVDLGDMWSDAKGFFVRIGTGVRDTVTGSAEGTSGYFGTQLEAATQTEYKGAVESQQGRPLGVYIQNQRPIQPFFSFYVNQTPSSTRTIVWYGDLVARTFADSLTTELLCVYEHEKSKPLNSSATPGNIEVFFTGEFIDTYPFTCELPMLEVYKATQNGTDFSGKFYTQADFEFQTWGYATLTFMDRSAITAFRREGKDPARELGIDSYVQARYTPGPVSLGMLDRQNLPIGIDTQNPESTFIPAFGVTLQNLWAGRGEVRTINSLVFQVPDPLMLDAENCVGNVDADGKVIKPRIRNPGAIGNIIFSTDEVSDEIPEGYTWYEFPDLSFDADERLRTVRCPMMVANDRYDELIGADLSVREFTLVALADYDYRSQTPVSVSLRRERIQ